MEDLVNRLLRELPDTDKSRYDIAYARGRAQARSSLLVSGIAIGVAVGAAAVALFDPSTGRSRRAELRQRVAGMTNQLRQTMDASRRDIRNRAYGAATELGLPGTPESNAEKRAHEAVEAGVRPELRTPPRSSVAPGMGSTPVDDREPVGAGAER